jgi:hypothetical protein
MYKKSSDFKQIRPVTDYREDEQSWSSDQLELLELEDFERFHEDDLEDSK